MQFNKPQLTSCENGRRYQRLESQVLGQNMFSKMVKEAGGQLFQHPLIKLEVLWVQPEEMIPSPKTVSLPLFK